MGCGSTKEAGSQVLGGAPTSTSVVSRSKPLAAPKESTIEVVYAENQTVIGGAVGIVALLVGASGLPGAAALEAIMTGVIAAADKATDNRENCKQLVTLVTTCDQGLGKIDGKGIAVMKDCETQLAQLKEALQSVEKLVIKFGHTRGMFLRLLMASIDEKDFAAAHKALTDAMMALSLKVSLGIASLPVLHYKEDIDDMLGRALQRLGNDGNWRKALSNLREQGRLSELHEFLSPQEQFMVDFTVATVHDLNGKGKVQKPPALSDYMATFWNSITFKDEIKAEKFLRGLEKWMVDKGHSEMLTRLDEELFDLAPLNSGTSAASSVFMEHVLLSLADDNKDGMITTAEMVQLQVIAGEFAACSSFKEPSSIPDMLIAIFKGTDKALLAERLAMAVRSEEELLVLDGLHAQSIIDSYKTSELLSTYVVGSRVWLYQRITHWLDTVAPMPARSSAGAAIPANLLNLDAQSRMFLLLGGPGMGKSVFSAIVKSKLVVRNNAGGGMVAVQHFFKVGQPRGQAKAMVMSLAYQLAVQLPGMSSLIAPVVVEHGAGGSLSLLQAFERYLLEPLQALGKKGPTPPSVLFLLDALDEADDAGRGWLPVAALVAKEFSRLPPFVRIILTSRPEASHDAASSSPEGQPQVADMFKAWEPVQIHPGSQENLADMELVLRFRLKEGHIVEEEDLTKAVAIMLHKSMGQFVWLKFAFDQLSERPGFWRLDELVLILPEGLNGTYRYLLGRVRRTLQAGTPEQQRLWDLLHERTLPVLLVAREALSVAKLAWLAGVRPEDARQGVELLGSLFPYHVGQDRILPYHKSVLDWLGSEVDAGVELVVRREVGHHLSGAACLNVAMGLQASLYAPPVAEAPSEEALKEQYALRHCIPHLVKAGDGSWASIDSLALQFGFVQHAYASGVGSSVLRDLLISPASSPVVDDVTRWLSNCNAFLAKHPQATMQMAVDAPTNSLVAKAAALHPCQPPASLTTKAADWPALKATWVGSSAQVLCVATCFNGKVIASACADNTIRLWDCATGEVKVVLEGHTSSVNTVVFSRDGRTLISGSNDKTIRVWNMASGQEEKALVGHEGDVNSVALSADGLTLVSGSEDRTIRVWNLASGREEKVMKGHGGEVLCVAISVDGLTVVSGSWDKTIRVWNLASGLEERVLESHGDRVYCVDISADGLTLVSGSDNKTIRVWDLASGRVEKVLEGHGSWVSSLAISADGLILVSGSHDLSIRVWNLALGREEKVLWGHGGKVHSVAISADGLTLASGSEDKTIRVWNLTLGLEEWVHELHGGTVRSVAINVDGLTMVSGCHDCTITVWNLASGLEERVLKGHGGRVLGVAISADGLTIVSGSDDRTIRVWNLASGREEIILKGHEGEVFCVAISADGLTVVSGSSDKTVRVWSLPSGREEKVLEGHGGRINSVAISPDGLTMVSGSSDKTIRVWNLASGLQEMVMEGHACRINTVAFSTDGLTLASGSDDCTIRVWNLSSGLVERVLEGHRDWVSSVIISIDGMTLVSGSQDKTIRVWNLSSGLEERVMEGHGGIVRSVAISIDGLTMVSGSDDRTIRIWSFDDGRCLEVLRGSAERAKLAEAEARPGSDENPLIATSADGSGQVVDLTSSAGVEGIARIYITPPLQLDIDTMRLSAGRLAAFTNLGAFMSYKLH